MGLLKAQLRGKWEGPTLGLRPRGDDRWRPQARQSSQGMSALHLGEREENGRRPGRDGGNKGRGEGRWGWQGCHCQEAEERDAQEQAIGRQAKQRARDQAEENKGRGGTRALPGVFSRPQPTLLEGPGQESGQQRSFRGRRRLSRFGHRHPGPGAGSVPASSPGRRGGRRSGTGQSLHAAAESSGS